MQQKIGGYGLYTVSTSQTVASTQITASSSAVVIARWSGTMFVVLTVTSGVITIGQTLTANGIIVGTTITAFGSGTGGTGSYVLSVAQTFPGVLKSVSASSTAVFTASITTTTMTVTNIVSGIIALGQSISGTGVSAGTTITGLVTGGVGTYQISKVPTASGSGLITPLLSGQFSGLKLNFAQNNTASFIDTYSRTLVMINFDGYYDSDLITNPQFSGMVNQVYDITPTRTATAMGTWIGTSLTITSVVGIADLLCKGQFIGGTGITGGTKILSQLNGNPGTTGTYIISQAQAADTGGLGLSITITASPVAVGVGTWSANTATLTISSTTFGAFEIGQTVSAIGIVPGTTIIAFSAGVYTLSITQTTSGNSLSISGETLEVSPSMILDDYNDILGWTDSGNSKLYFYRYVPYAEDFFPYGTAYATVSENRFPMGAFIDKGMANPQFGSYLDCYGHGRCTGAAGNWVCDCDKGYYGNCATKNCPYGIPWFSEPAVDDIAHDIPVECSNAGICDRTTGNCLCGRGYEGIACERSQCSGATGDSWDCSGRGRCFSMRDLAATHLNSEGSSDPVIYGTNPHDPSTWDADMVFGCAADTYGYFPRSIEMLTAAQSFATPSLKHIHNISAALMSDLSGLSCPYTYNTRLKDAIYPSGSSQFTASWTATTLSVTAVSSGVIKVGQILVGNGLAKRTTVVAFLTGTGGVGTYTISADAFSTPPLPQSGEGINVVITASSPSHMTFQEEVQSITCTATSGNFAFTFRGETTKNLDAATCTAGDLQTALEDLTSIGEVSVSVTSGNGVICSAGAGITSLVTFHTEFGKIPTLIVTGTAIASFTIANHVEAPKNMLVECGGKGSCDASTGQCVCWPNWGSSDGFGSAGTLGDCGHSLIY